MIFKRHILTVISRVCHCEAKLRQSLFWVIIIALFLFFPSPLFAETKDSILSLSKEIISEGTYNMGDGETPSVAESRALLHAKRTVVGDGILFWVKIKAKVNPDKIEEMAKRVKEKSVIDDYKKIQEAYDKSQKEIEELKKQLAGAKGEKEKKQVEAKITDDERLFEASQWFEKGYQYILNNEYDSAIEAFTKAIALDPNYTFAYLNRGGAVYVSKGQYDMAIEDYNKAIALDPNDAAAYNNRGVAYGLSGNMGRAISDFQKACDMGNEKGCKGLQMVLEKR